MGVRILYGFEPKSFEPIFYSILLSNILKIGQLGEILGMFQLKHFSGEKSVSKYCQTLRD